MGANESMQWGNLQKNLGKKPLTLEKLLGGA